MSVKIVLCIVLYWCIVSATDFSRLAPYEVKLRSLADCKQDSTPYNPKHILAHKLEIYKKSRLNERIRGELTVPRDGMQLHLTVDAFCWLESGFNKMIETVHVECGHPIMKLLYEGMNVVLGDNCTLQQGTYKFDDLSVDTLMHQLVETMFLGRFMFVFRFRSERAVVLCVETVTDTTPSKLTAPTTNNHSPPISLR